MCCILFFFLLLVYAEYLIGTAEANNNTPCDDPCGQGACKFRDCQQSTSCRGGACSFTNCVDPICEGN